uniref:Uncharacterized protein n=1 Tax=Anas zonorhyncha TaxID=75864 RepID=A0A8B9U757_9AVES
MCQGVSALPGSPPSDVPLQPAVLGHLPHAGPRGRAEAQQLGDEGSAGLRQRGLPLRVQHPLLLLLGHAADVRVVEGHVAGHHHEEHHPQAPHVVLLGVVGDAQQHLGGRVGCRAAEGGAQLREGAGLLAETEIGQLGPAAVGGQQHVLALEVPVHQVAVVQVAHGPHHLGEDVAGLGDAGQLPPLLHQLQQVGGRRLHHDVELAVAHLDQLEDAHDVGVPDPAQDGELPRQELVDEGRGGSAPVHHLDGQGDLVLAGGDLFHLGEAALAQGLAQLVAQLAEQPLARVGFRHVERSRRASPQRAFCSRARGLQRMARGTRWPSLSPHGPTAAAAGLGAHPGIVMGRRTVGQSLCETGGVRCCPPRLSWARPCTHGESSHCQIRIILYIYLHRRF